jgi:hypothetical protein
MTRAAAGCNELICVTKHWMKANLGPDTGQDIAEEKVAFKELSNSTRVPSFLASPFKKHSTSDRLPITEYLRGDSQRGDSHSAQDITFSNLNLS